jgi:hypothetical protein
MKDDKPRRSGPGGGGGGGGGGGNRSFSRRRKFCRFTAEGVKQIDYKDLGTLKHESVLSAPALVGDQACALPRAAAVHRPALR